MEAFLGCIAIATEQKKDKTRLPDGQVWAKKTILQPIGKSLNHFQDSKTIKQKI